MFHRRKSPRACWEETGLWYKPLTAGAQSRYSRKLHKFKVSADANPGEALYDIDEMVDEIKRIVMTVYTKMLYSCNFAALPPSEYSLEVWDLKGKLDHDRSETLCLVRTQNERLRSTNGKGKSPSNAHALCASDGERGGDGRRERAGGRRRGS